MNALSFDDRQIVIQALSIAAPHLTPRQRAVVGTYALAGLTQVEAGKILDIHQTAVSRDWKAAFEIICKLKKLHKIHCV